MLRTFVLFMCLLVSFGFSPSVCAEKTDVVVLKNGDKITGEVKRLQRGKLEFSTDTMGTVYIDWDDIEAVISETGHSTELSSGERFYGTLAKSQEENQVIINTDQGPELASNEEIVDMYPVEATFWERLDISASLGFSWDKGSSVGKYNLGLDAEYRDPRFITKATLSSEVTTQEGIDNTSRASADILHNVFKPNKKFVTYFASIEQNDELGLDYRALGGAGYGWAPIRTNHNWFSLSGGLDVNHERATDGEEETNLEAVGMVTYEYYKYSDPERRWSTNLVVFPSLSNFGRVRAQFNTDFRLEFVDDLFWVFDIFASYDSEPLASEASNSDYGFTSSLAYKF